MVVLSYINQRLNHVLGPYLLKKCIQIQCKLSKPRIPILVSSLTSSKPRTTPTITPKTSPTNTNDDNNNQYRMMDDDTNQSIVSYYYSQMISYYISHMILPFACKLLSIQIDDISKERIENNATENISTTIINSNNNGKNRTISTNRKQHQQNRNKLKKRPNIIKQHRHTQDDDNYIDNNITIHNIIRLQVVEEVLRPILLPNENYYDIMKLESIMQSSPHFMKWLRTEYLLHQYHHASKLYNQSVLLDQQRQQASNDNNNNSLYELLPSTILIQNIFDMKDWKLYKDIKQTLYHRHYIITKQLSHLGMMYIRDGSIGIPYIIPPPSSISDNNDIDDNDIIKLCNTISTKHLLFEEILECSSIQMIDCGILNTYFEMKRNTLYQLWTKEYIQLLGNYIQQRIDTYQTSLQNNNNDNDIIETIILDIGAGDGKLTKLLRSYYDDNHQHKITTTTSQQQQQQQQKTTIIATDNGSWNISKSTNDVLRMNVEQALQQYCNSIDNNKIVIVLCSWMPMSIDWTQLFRQYNVNEYILIGEYDNGQCGNNWDTWGNIHFYDNNDEDDHDDKDDKDNQNDHVDHMSNHSKKEITETKVIPPHIKDGYERYDLQHLLPYQISRYDTRVSKNAMTISFRRT